MGMYFTPRSMWVKNLYQNVGAYTGFFKYIRFHNILRISTAQSSKEMLKEE